MKKFLSLALGLFLNHSMFAFDFQIGALCYTITSTFERTVSVEASSNSLSGDIVIPSVVTYNNVDFNVTYIADNAFAKCHGITSFTIPNSVKGIGYLGFGWCWYLQTIILDNPRSSFSVGNYSFNYDWRAFKTVRIINIDEKDLLNNGAGILGSSSLPTHDLYINGERIVDYKVSDDVETINTCFRNCNSIESLSMPNSVKTIVSFACYGCTALKTITLSAGLESIGYNAFAECPELRNIYVKSEKPASIDASTFPNGAYMFATVHVPKGTLSAYKNASIWANFANIVETDYDDVPNPQTPKCSVPKINYANGKLRFTCETDGAEYIANISDADVKTHYGNDISLTATYTISVYAIAAGYENSDIATATLCWLDAEPKTEGMISNIATARGNAILIQSNNGTLNISGAQDGDNIAIYTLSGAMVGSSKATGASTTFTTNLKRGEMVIVRVRDKSVKIVLQ